MQLEQYLESSRQFLAELTQELILEGQQERTVRVLKAVCAALRERLLVHESFDLLAELPPLIKVFYIEGWKPGKDAPQVRNIQSFIARVQSADPSGESDFATETDVMDAVNAVFRVFKRHVSKGECADISAGLPEDLKAVWDVA